MKPTHDKSVAKKLILDRSKFLYAPVKGQNGPIKKVFSNVWVVEGFLKTFPASIKRTMTIVRHNDQLALINSVWTVRLKKS